ncbi:hypothetical protein DICVIV_07684 [Dictyocaulus viviparus]|uniref:Uncharacterized protein n=1 Tax=Dictyocaulus viviparus TaxID=29172 RepID=A0A0D8XNQ0_DICVI|nr:hypothetical protein DICVIV_07684 [Dictyocaulus viviparus]
MRCYRVTEEMLKQVNLDLVARGQEFYTHCIQRGMNITNLEDYLMNDVDFVDILSFMDYFVRTAFFKMANSQEVLLFLASIDSTSPVILKDWSWSLCFLLSALCCVPECVYSRMVNLTTSWFACGDHDVGASINRWVMKSRSRYGYKLPTEDDNLSSLEELTTLAL